MKKKKDRKCLLFKEQGMKFVCLITGSFNFLFLSEHFSETMGFQSHVPYLETLNDVNNSQ